MTHPGATPSDKHKVVVIGSGFGGLNAVKTLKRADVDIKMIAKTTHHLFQPLLYQVATGIISEGEIAPLTRVILRKQKNCQVLLGEVENIDLEARTVTSKLMTMETVLPFDYLIVAAGAEQMGTSIASIAHSAVDAASVAADGQRQAGAVDERMRALAAFDPPAARSAARSYATRYPGGFARAEADALATASP